MSTAAMAMIMISRITAVMIPALEGVFALNSTHDATHVTARAGRRIAQNIAIPHHEEIYGAAVSKMSRPSSMVVAPLVQ